MDGQEVVSRRGDGSVHERTGGRRNNNTSLSIRLMTFESTEWTACMQKMGKNTFCIDMHTRMTLYMHIPMYMYIYINMYKYTGIAHFSNAVSTKSCKISEAYDTPFQNTKDTFCCFCQSLIFLSSEKIRFHPELISVHPRPHLSASAEPKKNPVKLKNIKLL